MNMITIRIRTKSTTAFLWSGCGSRGLLESETRGLREAVVESLREFRAYAGGDGVRDGVQACLVTWEDGDSLYAFLYAVEHEVPADLPWVLMRTQPARVSRRLDP